MISPNQLYEHLHTAAFNKDVTFVELLHIALTFAVFWYFVFEIIKIPLGKWSHGKPWLKVRLTDAGYNKGTELASFLPYPSILDRQVVKGRGMRVTMPVHTTKVRPTPFNARRTFFSRRVKCRCKRMRSYEGISSFGQTLTMTSLGERPNNSQAPGPQLGCDCTVRTTRKVH